MVKKVFESPEDRLSEIQLYELVAQEIKNGKLVEGLWEKSLADCKGDEKQARGHYSKLRVLMIQDEWAHKEKKEKDRLKKKQESDEVRQRVEERQRQSKKKTTEDWGQKPRTKTPQKPDWVFYLALGWMVFVGITFLVWIA